ncbi:MAG TPA: c-type cytochrome [Polyangiaceae bacterium]|nr:c-type cytochrome [Polyangiaceae bacterium]
MLVRALSLVLVGGCIAATACGGDDDATATPTGVGGSAAAGKAGSGSAGKAGATEAGGTGEMAGASEGGAGNTEDPHVARGSYLVNHVAACPDCHTPRDDMGAPILDKFLSGAECFVQLPNGDCLNSRNLTSDATGLANFSDDEIKDMIQNGMAPTADGGKKPLNPVMPYYVYHNISADDIDDIVAYLRTVPPVEHDVPADADSFTVPAAANPVDPATIPMPAEDFADQASALRGRYLAGVVGVCLECHTKHEDAGSADVIKPENFFAGGELFQVGLPNNPVSANLTSDSDTGLGDWTTDQIVKVLLEGVDDEGKGICPPMPVGPMGAFGGLTQDDATDIANYIKSLPAISNQIDDMCSFPPGQ